MSEERMDEPERAGKTDDNAGIETSRLKWCDLGCPHADFPKEQGLDGSGSCRTFLALWCKKLKKIVTKNSPCSVKFGSRRPKADW